MLFAKQSVWATRLQVVQTDSVALLRHTKQTSSGATAVAKEGGRGAKRMLEQLRRHRLDARKKRMPTHEAHNAAWPTRLNCLLLGSSIGARARDTWWRSQRPGRVVALCESIGAPQAVAAARVGAILGTYPKRQPRQRAAARLLAHQDVARTLCRQPFAASSVRNAAVVRSLPSILGLSRQRRELGQIVQGGLRR